MSITDRISYLWNKALEDAIGSGHAAPFDYADASVASLRSHLRNVENLQRHPNGFARPNQAGIRQHAQRRA